ncbi:unnamed protein product [Cylicostephanus goldi]|uniref:Uncharacterized protein n=1 Tax=Cylicostephanus goldi TaxID=71465 RepID=A0A3P7PMK6_CYLGO|nr:unnamed protein product [Cylicostephanus goldi]
MRAVCLMKQRLEALQRGLESGNWQKLRRQQPDQTENLEIAIEDIRDYWQAIVGVKRPFTESSELSAWATEVRARQIQPSVQTPSVQIEQADWQKLWINVKTWKAPGPGGSQAYWWTNLAYARQRLQRWCEKPVKGRKCRIPLWLAHARVVLIAKKRKHQQSPGD